MQFAQVSRPVASIGAGGGGGGGGGQLPPPEGLALYQLTLTNLHAHLYSLAGIIDLHSIAISPKSRCGVIKVGMAQQNFSLLPPPPRLKLLAKALVRLVNHFLHL